MYFIERFTLRRAWDGLTDDELLWEPTEGAWSVRPVDQSRTATPFVTGALEADYDSDLVMGTIDGKDNEPLTTIAWLFWHVGSMPGRAAELDIFGGAHRADTGWTSPYSTPHPI